jgi:Ca2+-binding RTX toxin-like protein
MARIRGTRFGDRLNGTSSSDLILGLGGDDILNGRGGNDKIKGGAGNDRIKGGSGHDDLFGGTGHDDLFGGSGDDFLHGGSGSDYFWGGSGFDSFAFSDFDGSWNNVVPFDYDDIVWDYDDAFDVFDLSGVASAFSTADILLTFFDGQINVDAQGRIGTEVAYGDDGFGGATSSFFVVGYTEAQWSESDFEFF